jgi:hypothetical protein
MATEKSLKSQYRAVVATSVSAKIRVWPKAICVHHNLRLARARATRHFAKLRAWRKPSAFTTGRGEQGMNANTTLHSLLEMAPSEERD